MKKTTDNIDRVWRNTILTFLLASVLSACSTTQAPAITPTPSETPAPALTSTPTLVPTPIRLGDYELLSPEDMRYDLDELFHRIETTHPNPYAKRPKAEVDLERQIIYDELDHPMTLFDYYNQVAPLVVSLGDFHTQVILPYDLFDEVVSKEKFIPLEVEFEGGRGFIIFNPSGNSDIPVGSELLTINRETIANIQNELIFRNPRDYPFSFGLWIINGFIPEYKVEVIRPGEANPIKVNISSLSPAEINQNVSSVPSQTYEPLTYTKISDESIGVLTVNDFVDINPLLETAFTQIHEDDVQNLIIDIRSNFSFR